MRCRSKKEAQSEKGVATRKAIDLIIILWMCAGLAKEDTKKCLAKRAKVADFDPVYIVRAGPQTGKTSRINPISCLGKVSHIGFKNRPIKVPFGLSSGRNCS